LKGKNGFRNGKWGNKHSGGKWFAKKWGGKPPGPGGNFSESHGQFGRPFGKGPGGNWHMKKWGRGPHRGGFLTKKFWWNRSKNKHTPAGKFRRQHKRIAQRLMKYWKKCVAKHKKCFCKRHIIQKKKAIWNKFHKKHWRENLMRWNRMKHRNHKKWQMAKNNFEHPQDFKPMEALKAKLINLKKEVNKSSDDKQEIIRLKKAIVGSDKDQFLGQDFEMYKKQADLWYKSDAGSCVSLYAKDYFNNLSKFWGISEDQRTKNREEIKGKIELACKNVEQYQPFANGGCMIQLANQYHELIAVFKEFLHNKSDGDTQKRMIDGVVNGFNIIKKECFEKLHNKHENCGDYVRKELDLEEDTEEKLKNANAFVKAIKIGFKWNKLGRSIKKLSDEGFWLNSPDECDVVKQADETIKAIS